jgi:hypothetical protein
MQARHLAARPMPWATGLRVDRRRRPAAGPTSRNGELVRTGGKAGEPQRFQAGWRQPGVGAVAGAPRRVSWRAAGITGTADTDPKRFLLRSAHTPVRPWHRGQPGSPLVATIIRRRSSRSSTVYARSRGWSRGHTKCGAPSSENESSSTACSTLRVVCARRTATTAPNAATRPPTSSSNQMLGMSTWASAARPS